jgi:hypothetical protein
MSESGFTRLKDKQDLSFIQKSTNPINPKMNRILKIHLMRTIENWDWGD